MVKIDLISQETVMLARSIFGYDFVSLHRPVFEGNERQYLINCLVIKNANVDVSTICREVSKHFNFRIAKSIQMNNSLLSFYFLDNFNPLDIANLALKPRPTMKNILQPIMAISWLYYSTRYRLLSLRFRVRGKK